MFGKNRKPLKRLWILSSGPEICFFCTLRCCMYLRGVYIGLSREGGTVKESMTISCLKIMPSTKLSLIIRLGVFMWMMGGLFCLRRSSKWGVATGVGGLAKVAGGTCCVLFSSFLLDRLRGWDEGVFSRVPYALQLSFERDIYGFCANGA